MDSQVIQPQPGQTVVTTETGHRHRDEGHHRGESWDQTILREQAAGFRVAATDAQTTMRDIKDTRFDLSGDVGRAAAAQALASGHMGEEMQEGFGGVKGAVSHIGERTSDGFSRAVAAVSHVGEETAEGLCDVKERIAQGSKESALAAKDQLALSYQIEGRSLLEAAKNASLLSVQADKNNAQVQLQAQTFASASALQAQTIASAATLQAQQIAAEAARIAAECCCELKSLIVSDGNTTRALVNDQTIQALRDRAATSDRQLAAYYARNAPPVVPA